MKITETTKFKTICSNNNNKWMTFVHGFTHDNTYFKKQADLFKNEYNILLINLMGHGERFEDNGPFSIEKYSTDIIDIIIQLKIKSTIFWGTHTGAACGLYIACKSLISIDYLILEGTPVPGINIPSINKYFSSAKVIYDNYGLTECLDHWLTNSGWFRHMLNNSNNEIISSHSLMLIRYKGKHFNYNMTPSKLNLTKLISKINIPCLMYNGEFDLSDFKDATKEVVKLNNNIISEIIINTGGFPSWEDNNQVYSVVSKFIKSSQKQLNMNIPIPGKKVRGSETGSPIMAILDLLGRKWSLGIIWNMSMSPMTFRQIQAKCESISPAILNSRLKDLREAEIVERTLDGYILNKRGLQLQESLKPIGKWADSWAIEVFNYANEVIC